MPTRPTLDLDRLSGADRILLSAGLLLFVDSFLPWQRVCVAIVRLVTICLNYWSAWVGTARLAGIVMGALTLLLVALELLFLADIELPFDMSPDAAATALAYGVALFGLIKVLFAVTNQGAFGAWVGLVLVLLVGYGGYRKNQEANLPMGGGNLRR